MRYLVVIKFLIFYKSVGEVGCVDRLIHAMLTVSIWSDESNLTEEVTLNTCRGVPGNDRLGVLSKCGRCHSV